MLILGTLGTMEATGLYNAASRLSMLNIFPLRVVDTIIPPKIAAAFHAGNYTEIRSLVKKATLMSTIGSLPLFAIMMLFPEQLLALFGKPFIEASPYLRILACGQFVNALTGPVGFTLLMTGNERFYRNVLMTVASFSVLANLWAVPRFAALGAAWVMAASIVILNVALYLGVYKKIFALR